MIVIEKETYTLYSIGQTSHLLGFRSSHRKGTFGEQGLKSIPLSPSLKRKEIERREKQNPMGLRTPASLHCFDLMNVVLVAVISTFINSASAFLQPGACSAGKLPCAFVWQRAAIAF